MAILLSVGSAPPKINWAPPAKLRYSETVSAEGINGAFLPLFVGSAPPKINWAPPAKLRYSETVSAEGINGAFLPLFAASSACKWS